MNSSEIVLASLGSNYVQVHEYLLRGLKGDCTSAIILSKLVSFYKYNQSNDSLGHDDSFPFKSSFIEENLGISEYHQRVSLDFLKSKNLISVEFKGFPKRRYIKLEFKNIKNLLQDHALVAKKPTAKQLSKMEFYKELNDSMRMPLNQAMDYAGNISKSMFEFMYGWYYAYIRSTGDEWLWTPKQFGILKKYWVHCYSYKKYDYNKLDKFYEIALNDMENWVLYNWSVFDRTQHDILDIKDIHTFIDNFKGD